MSKARDILNSLKEALKSSPTNSHTKLNTVKPLDNEFVKKWDKKNEATYALLEQKKQVVVLAITGPATKREATVGTDMLLVGDPVGDNVDAIGGRWSVLNSADTSEGIKEFKPGIYPLHMMSV